MTREEFNQWFEEHCNRFPETAAWLNQAKDKRATLLAWFEILADCDLSDCLAATRDVFSGRESPIAAYDRERTPSIIKSIARIHAGNRVAGSRPPNWMDSTDDPRVCELCRGGGIVMRPDSQGRMYGWRCPCTKGETFAKASFRKLGSREKVPLAVWGETGNEPVDIYDWQPPERNT